MRKFWEEKLEDHQNWFEYKENIFAWVMVKFTSFIIKQSLQELIN